MKIPFDAGEISSKTYTRPICKEFFFQSIYISLNPIRVELKYTIYLWKWLKLHIEKINVNFKLIIRCENKFLMILDFIFERIPFLKQLPDFSSCHVFGTYPGFETITGIHNHINVNF